MKRIALAATLVAAWFGAHAADGAHVALFKNVEGPVKVVRQAAVVDAAPGVELFVSDRLVSGAGGSAGIVFRDGTQLTLGPSSEIDVRDYVFEPADEKYQFDVYLAKGTAIYASGKIGKLSPQSVKVSTPTATVGVRGTRFILQAD
ncbi:MAG TPA: FecR family protein [Burkholderiaceae bacterium]|nr:FecR family protein [Burkholderiaceae bacterium]